eukprot:373825_1
MSTTIPAIEWITLTGCGITGTITIPTGIDANNCIVIGRTWKINHIYKYNIHNDNWLKLNINNLGNISMFTAALNVEKQTLFLCHSNNLTEIQLNNNHISNY